MDGLAQPALAGIAVSLLGIGVVTWLPALAAAASRLDRWRREGDPAVFTGTFSEFVPLWRLLWRPAIGVGVALVIIVLDIGFLAGRPEPWAHALAAVLVGVGIALVTWAVALAVVCGTVVLADDEQSAGDERTDDAVRLDRVPWAAALTLGFGRPGGLLIIVALLAGFLLIPTGIGPFLYGPTIPLLVGRRVWLARQRRHRPPAG